MGTWEAGTAGSLIPTTSLHFIPPPSSSSFCSSSSVVAVESFLNPLPPTGHLGKQDSEFYAL